MEIPVGQSSLLYVTNASIVEVNTDWLNKNTSARSGNAICVTICFAGEINLTAYKVCGSV